ncbi:hypothetical protein N1851_003415 [Merluccius polli]|uniref:Uncharacterized protein n=1 Tax=Merluccius polli TaxID=89951 RepID=A0AA47N8P4_MERPO|nr:hypothetical protein N1851_003415 [Merluccius polli]
MPPSDLREDASLGFSPTSKQSDEIMRDPCVKELLPSCPQRSVIPGIASLEQQLDVDWPADEISLLEKLPNKRMVSCVPSNYEHLRCGDSVIIANMVNMTTSCPKSTSITGFPTALKQEPNMVNVLPTCPRVTSVPGLASTGFDSCCKEWVMDRSFLWNKKVQIKEQFISHINPVDTMMIRAMVAMMPTCPRNTWVPGFPSAEKQKVSDSPSMICLLPTCPEQTIVTGMPSRHRVQARNIYSTSKGYGTHIASLSQDDNHPWVSLHTKKGGKLCKPSADMSKSSQRHSACPLKCVLRVQISPWHKAVPLVWLVKNREILFSHIDHNQHITSADSEMVAILPSCPMSQVCQVFHQPPKE